MMQYVCTELKFERYRAEFVFWLRGSLHRGFVCCCCLYVTVLVAILLRILDSSWPGRRTPSHKLV
jgi:hypothetical protein